MSYVLKIKSRFSGDTKLVQQVNVTGFMSNCGYFIVSLNAHRQFTGVTNKSTKDNLIRLANKAIYNELIRQYSYRNGGRKLVFSGDFSSHDEKFEKNLGNRTGVFMLQTPVEFVGEATPGKESGGEHWLQLGEINIKEDMEKLKLPRNSRLYSISFREGGW
jgi:hypothetical protein